jgi:hypothetical protein
MDEIVIRTSRPRMPTIETGGATGVSPESANMPGDVRATVQGIYEMLKVIMQRMDENMPYITRACDRDGGK